MTDKKLSGFRYVKGRVVPVFKYSMIAGQAAQIPASYALSKIKKQNVPERKVFKKLGGALAVTSGIVAGASFFTKSTKGALGSLGLSAALSIASTTSNAMAYAGTDKLKKRSKAILRQEGINNLWGWTALGATVLAVPSQRKAAASTLARFLKRG